MLKHQWASQTKGHRVGDNISELEGPKEIIKVWLKGIKKRLKIELRNKKHGECHIKVHYMSVSRSR